MSHDYQNTVPLEPDPWDGALPADVSNSEPLTSRRPEASGELTIRVDASKHHERLARLERLANEMALDGDDATDVRVAILAYRMQINRIFYANKPDESLVRKLAEALSNSLNKAAACEQVSRELYNFLLRLEKHVGVYTGLVRQAELRRAVESTLNNPLVQAAVGLSGKWESEPSPGHLQFCQEQVPF